MAERWSRSVEGRPIGPCQIDSNMPQHFSVSNPAVARFTRLTSGRAEPAAQKIAINLKTAKALGLTVPPSPLTAADVCTILTAEKVSSADRTACRCSSDASFVARATGPKKLAAAV